MKDPAPTKSKSKQAEVDQTPTWQKYANAILIPVIIGLAIYLLVRYRINANEAARVAEQQTLTAIRSRIHNLREADLDQMSPEMIDNLRDTRYRETDKLIADLLATAKDPAMRAEILIARGDLNWTVAQIPDLPGATTQPNLEPEVPRDRLLAAAESAYNEVLTQHADRPLAVNSARLGLAAIAENRRQFDEAAKFLQAVEDDANAPEAFKLQAKAQREQLKTIRQPIYIAPATQPAPAVESATTQPTTNPA